MLRVMYINKSGNLEMQIAIRVVSNGTTLLVETAYVSTSGDCSFISSSNKNLKFEQLKFNVEDPKTLIETASKTGFLDLTHATLLD